MFHNLIDICLFLWLSAVWDSAESKLTTFVSYFHAWLITELLVLFEIAIQCNTRRLGYNTYTYKLKLNAPSVNPIPLQKDVQIEASIISNTVLYGVLQRLRTQDILLAEAVQILGWAPHSFPFSTFHSFPFF